MRPRKPWYRSGRDAWFVQHLGRQVLLARGKANKAEAMAAYHKLMLVGEGVAIKPESFSVAVLCDLFLDYSKNNQSASAYESYRRFLQSYCDRHGKLGAMDVKPFHITRWLDAHPTWKGARRHAIVAVKRAYSWGEQQGLITANPIRTIKAPSSGRRERILSPEERTLLLEATPDAAFKNFLKALMGTGCRPSEVAALTAEQVNLELGIWVFRQHKTVAKTGKSRVVYLSPEMIELTKAQLAKHPSGPLFPNTRGKAFSRNSWRCRFRRLREKHPELEGVVCYSCRHDYATQALLNGVGIAQVAELLGHRDASMVGRVYGHIAQNLDHMRQAAKQAAENSKAK